MMVAPSNSTGMSLAGLLEGLVDGLTVPGISISGLAIDSRAVKPGDVFMACQGLRVHALAHAEQAINRGAVAVLWEQGDDTALSAMAGKLNVVALALAGLSHKLGLIADRFYAHPSRDMHVIGVTGTDGKTSVAHFIAQALSSAGHPCGLLGTLGYGVYGDLQQASHTTPDALRLQAEFARLRDAGVQQLAMEVSSHALHQRRTEGTAFNTAVLTQLSRDHLDYHGSVEAYAEAKRRLFETAGLETAVLNVNDDFGRQLAGQLTPSTPIIAYGHAGDQCSEIAAHWIELDSVTPQDQGIAMRLSSSWGAFDFSSPLLGTFNAENLMAVLGALLASGLRFEEASDRLRKIRTVPGRMELFSQPGLPRVVVDYAHTPHALEAALRALRAHCSGELICVFGAGGDRDTGKRPHMGSAAERFADRVVLTSDNPRSESAAAIADQIAAGFEQPERAQRILDRAQAITETIAGAAQDDLLLIAGKGHEGYQQIGDQRVAFSDRTRVLEALWGRAE